MNLRRIDPQVLQAKREAEARERSEARKAANLSALASVPAHRLHQGTYSADIGIPASIPKAAPRRNARLLAMARLMPCLLLVPGCCNHRQDTTVACHSNLSIHGKAGARKADDCWTVYGCAACHAWLDAGPAPAEHKAALFMEAHARQVAVWTAIANDPANWCEADRRSACWALDQLKETAKCQRESI
jgi:hypothetical protein